ncbi:MAG: hypothetical protein PQJ58_19790 [Spirochaetales bacterium]|nr:hypothetical protein [Spirochaetales bacterium]
MKLPKPVFLLEEYGVYGFNLGSAWLLGMPYPPEARDFWTKMEAAGVDSVVCLTDDEAAYNPGPLKVLSAAGLSESSGSFTKEEGEAEALRYTDIARRMAQAIQAGQSVAAHCKGGTGRTGTIIGATLLEMGYPLLDVLQGLEEANALRNRGDHGWPESAWQMTLLESFSS